VPVDMSAWNCLSNSMSARKIWINRRMAIRAP
jgi:hypothetical protein